VYALDAEKGCLYWSIQVPAGIRTAMTVGALPGSAPPRYVVYFGDMSGSAHAVDAKTGEHVWFAHVDNHPIARLTGAPVLHENRLYVPVASVEEAAGADPKYQCCTFRGSVVALDAATGKKIWQAYTIPQKPKRTRKNKFGVQQWGPAGASVWSAPTVDAQHGLLYVTTGDNYADPASKTSDAIIAFDLKTGKFLWSRQFLAGDAWNISCDAGDPANCPKAKGPDLDFGSSSILRSTADGKRILLAGQKTGVLHAIDPDQRGKILWQQRVGKGGLIGGIQWGPAADDDKIYVALSDIGVKIKQDPEAGPMSELDGSVGGGIFAYKIATGEKVWSVPPPGCGGRPKCSPAQSAAVTVIPGAVFSGSVDGHLRAYSTQDGKVLWDFDTIQDFTTVNAMEGKGGSLDGPGPTVAGGMLFVNSGYGLWGGMPGNVLLAFSVDGK
jgi:polyvinyl alcohol dehydrogenase (cytochrome)